MVADRDVEEALARSFLGRLPPEVVAMLRSEGERADYPAGTTIYRAGSGPRAMLVVRGLIRIYMTSRRTGRSRSGTRGTGTCWGSRSWWAGRPT